MALIQLKGVDKTYPDGTKALRGMDLEIHNCEFLVLLGPSGCGKTTMLRLVAGLEKSSGGDIYFDGQSVLNRSPQDRNVAMVFQNYALYPHLNVFKNMAFPLKSRRIPPEEMKQRVEKAAEMLELTPLLNRKPRVLSTGQRQRVALGRAMVREPSVFLLDEPLSNLDENLREEMRNEIRKIHKYLNTTMIYVTHDQQEAMRLADRICVMKDGQVQQIDAAQRIYSRPSNLFVAEFMGTPKMNFLPARLRMNAGSLSADVYGQRLALPDTLLAADTALAFSGREVILGIRPENWRLDQRLMGQPGYTALRATVVNSTMVGSEQQVSLRLDGTQMDPYLATMGSEWSCTAGDEITLAVNGLHVQIFDPITEENLCGREVTVV